MKIKETRMEGNLYSKIDAENWMTIPRLAEIPKTSFLDVNKLVVFDKDLLANAKKKIEKSDLEAIFETF